jgi:hypothetical protein
VTTHLSTRRVWHRARDGHICEYPSKNPYCMVHQHIRDGRDDDPEDKAAGQPLAGLHGWQPPCSRDPVAFSPRGYECEQKLSSKDEPNDFKLPDFTVSYEGDTFYWEHLGMLSVPSHRKAWDRKREWYQDNGYLDRIITSEDGTDGSIDAAEIERIARKKILVEG